MNNSTNKRQILVVDDEPLVLETFTMLLRALGHDIVTANSGEAALALFEPGKFDLVLTDFIMPGMNGDKLAAEIKHRSPFQPVIAVTAHSEKLRHTPVPWFDSYISKPFGLQELRQIIEQYAPVG